MRRFETIDQTLLRALGAIADSDGFTDVQVALNLSRSVLQTHLPALQEKLSGALCERGRGNFRPALFGETTYRAAMTLFEAMGAFQSQVGRDRTMLVVRRRIGIIDGVVMNKAPLFREWARSLPRLRAGRLRRSGAGHASGTGAGIDVPHARHRRSAVLVEGAGCQLRTFLP